MSERSYKVYAVVYSNYIPYEVASLWSTEDGAKTEAKRKNIEAGGSNWEVQFMWINR